MTDKQSKVSNPLLTNRTRRTWAQTERSTHEAWGTLSRESPRAAALAHFLVAHMDSNTNAVVASWKVLSELSGMSIATVRRGMKDLEEMNWVQGVALGGGGAKAWVVNSRVAWAKSRDGLQYAAFNGRILASLSEQSPEIAKDNQPPLRRIPIISRGEQQLPTGPGEDPPSQPSLDGMEPPLPEIYRDDEGRDWEISPETGEAQQIMDGGYGTGRGA